MDDMENLLAETIDALLENNKTVADVLWCGTSEIYFDWEEYEKLANLIYNNGYGSPKIAIDLLIVGEDWWLERDEYDGSEWWELKTLKTKPKTERIPNQLNGGMWDTLAEINNWKDERSTLEKIANLLEEDD